MSDPSPMTAEQELEQIAKGYEIRSVHAQAGYGNQFPPEVIRALMAWHARRLEEPKPIWCHCIEWTGDEPRPWRNKADGEEVCGWRFCPTCGQQRPEMP